MFEPEPVKLKISNTARQILDKAITHAELLKNIIKMATLLGYEHDSTLISIGSDPGRPDLKLGRMSDDPYNPPTKKGIQSINHSWVKPRQIIMEIKREGQSPTDDQFWWLEFHRLRGDEVYVIWPSDWSSGLVEQILKGG